MDNKTILFITVIHMLMWFSFYLLIKRKADPFDPYFISTGLYALIFIYGPWVWINRGQFDYQGVSVMEYLPDATLVFNICFAVFSLFSFLRRKDSLRIKSNGIQTKDSGDLYQQFLADTVTQNYIAKYGFITFTVSFLLALLYFRLVGRSLLFMLTLGQGAELLAGRSGMGLYFLGQLTRTSICGILLLLAFSKENRKLIYVGAYLLFSVCTSTGSRNLAICLVLAIVVYFYLRANKRPKLVTILLGIVALYVFVGLVGIFRTAFKTGNAIYLDTATSDSMYEAFMFNVEIFYPFYTLVGYLKEGIISLHWGLGVLNIPLQFIPHIIWRSKPANLGLSGFEAMYGDSMGGAAYPNIGEFYYEFGIIGAMVGMALFAVISQEMFSFAKKTRNKISMIEYSLFFGYLMQFICRGHFASWAIDIVLLFGPLWFLKLQLKMKYNNWLVLHRIGL